MRKIVLQRRACGCAAGALSWLPTRWKINDGYVNSHNSQISRGRLPSSQRRHTIRPALGSNPQAGFFMRRSSERQGPKSFRFAPSERSIPNAGNSARHPDPESRNASRKALERVPHDIAPPLLAQQSESGNGDCGPWNKQGRATRPTTTGDGEAGHLCQPACSAGPIGQPCAKLLDFLTFDRFWLLILDGRLEPGRVQGLGTGKVFRGRCAQPERNRQNGT